MHKIILAISFLLFSSIANAQETPQPFSAVQTLFAAMSAGDAGAMRATSTQDFHLLEVGEIWGMDKLVSAVTPSDGITTRRNFFAVISTKTSGNRA